MHTRSVKNNKINVINLGCSKNIYDSKVLMNDFAQIKITHADHYDLYVEVVE